MKKHLKTIVAILVLSLVVVGAWLFYSHDVVVEKNKFEKMESSNVDLYAKTIAHHFGMIVTDLLFLAEMQQESFNDDDTDGSLTRVGDFLLALLRAKHFYHQARYIDSSGMEVSRVDMTNGTPALVPKDKLQYKGDRYYFKETMQLDKGDVYISRFDLNIEHGVIEKPPSPVIRFAMPVFDREGVKRGIVIVNYKGNLILQSLASVSSGHAGSVMLLDSDGYWLYGAEKSDLFGFMYEERKDRSFAKTYPKQWEMIRRAETGQFLADEGLFTFRTIHPYLDSRKAISGNGAVWSDSISGPGDRGSSDREYSWKIVSLLKPTLLQSESSALFTKLVMLYGLLVALLVAGSKLVDSFFRRTAILPKGYLSPVTLLLSSAVALFFGEMMVMSVMPVFQPLSPAMEAAVDSLLLSMLVMPMFYFLLFRPLILHIERRRRAEDKHKESEEKYHQVIEAANDAIFISDASTGVVSEANLMSEKLTGIEHDKIIGMNLSALFPIDRANKYISFYHDHLEKGKIISEDIEIIHKSGRRIPVDIRASKTTADGREIAISIFRDMAVQKRIERQIKDTKQFLEKVMESVSNAIFVVSLHGHYTMVNHGAEEISGYKADELVGKSFSSILEPGSRKKMKAYFIKSSQLGHTVRQCEANIITKNGKTRSVIFSLAPLYYEGKIASVVGAAADITQLKDMEKHREELMKNLKRAYNELKDFAYIVSHDLKAPLRGISSLAQWTAQDYADKLDDEGRENLKLLVSRTKRMHNLINGILQYSRVGRLGPYYQRINTGDITREIIETIDPPENILFEIDEDMPEIVYDKTHFHQIMQNLLSNAINNMDKPDGEIAISCDHEKNGYFVFHVKDNGRGIDKKHFERIFKIFQSLSSRDETEATGIGLSLVKKIVETNGGSVDVESSPGAGTEFSFSIPDELQINFDENNDQ